MINDTDIASLKYYFKSRPDIAFAFLFGSQALGTATKLSDIDIAVYFYPEKKHPIEYEEDVYYKGENEVCSGLERLLKKDVEMLVMNRVAASVVASAIRGIPLAINDWGLYMDFMEVITHEAEDFRAFYIDDYLERRAVERRTEVQTA